MTTTFWIIIVFIAGYAAIIGEHKTGVNKTAVALITAVLCWVLVSVGYFPQTDRAIGSAQRSPGGHLPGHDLPFWAR